MQFKSGSKPLGIYPFISKLLFTKSPQTIERSEQFRCHLNHSLLLVAGPDLNRRPPGYRSAPVAVVCRSLSPLSRRTRTLGDTARKNSSPDCFSFANPTSFARRAHNPHRINKTPVSEKEKQMLCICFFFLVAGAGFEPTTSGL